jgi:dTDP-4-amino-4,6-dideoxygalactose transaminase
MAMNKIPMVDLRAQYESIRGEIDAAIQSALDESAFIMGGRVKKFEDEFALFTGAGHAVGCSSGTAALHLALLASGVGKGDEVIVPAHTFVATAAAVCHCGAVPVFADVDAETYTVTADTVMAVLSPKTRAIIVVHIYGQSCDMGPIVSLARKHGVKIVEDCAQCHGAMCGDQMTGTFGVAGAFSFFPGKNLGAYGDGGAVITNDPDTAGLIRKLLNHGRVTKYEHDLVGFNYRLDAIQAAILSVKLRHLRVWTNARQRSAKRYRDLLTGLPVQLPVEIRGQFITFMLFNAMIATHLPIHWRVREWRQESTIRSRFIDSCAFVTLRYRENLYARRPIDWPAEFFLFPCIRR